MAKQRRRQHEQLVADLAQARLERQKLHQGVLTLRLKSRREQLERMTNRYHQLIEENRELKVPAACSVFMPLCPRGSRSITRAHACALFLSLSLALCLSVSSLPFSSLFPLLAHPQNTVSLIPLSHSLPLPREFRERSSASNDR